MGLQHFLLAPIQRIMKYPLLLREILKYTPDRSKDKAVLTKALAMVEVCMCVRVFVLCREPCLQLGCKAVE